MKIREGGSERRVTAAEAFLLQLAKRALEGDDAAARAAIEAIEEARERNVVIVRTFVDPAALHARSYRCEWQKTSIPAARLHGWSSNRGSSRRRWPGRLVVPLISRLR